MGRSEVFNLTLLLNKLRRIHSETKFYIPEEGDDEEEKEEELGCEFYP